jgi:hypothetical protein
MGKIPKVLARVGRGCGEAVISSEGRNLEGGILK